MVAFATNLLRRAVAIGDTNVVTLLLELGAEVNAYATGDYGCTDYISYTGYAKSPLQIASASGSMELVRTLLAAGADVNAFSDAADSALKLAVDSGNEHIVRLLLASGAEVNASHEYISRSPLVAAVRQQRSDIVEILVAAGADINLTDAQGENAVLDEIERGNLKTLQMLLDLGPDIEAVGSVGMSPLLEVAHRLDELGEEVFETLLDNGADIHAEYHGTGVLQRVIANGNVRLARRLLAKGANVKAPAGDVWPEPTALQAAVTVGDIDLVQLLLNRGAYVNAPAGPILSNLEEDDENDDYTFRSATALQAAVRAQDLKVTRLLLRYSADVNAAATDEAPTAFQRAVTNGNTELVKLLLEHGANINARGGERNGGTALQLAVRYKHLSLAHFLLTEGADVNAPASTRSGYTALQQAVCDGDNELVNVLLRHGADVNAPCSDAGTTAFGEAASSSNIQLVRQLLANGADVDGFTDNGRRSPTVLTLAISSNASREVVDLLLDAGAGVNVVGSLQRDNRENTALVASIARQRLDLINLLLQKGADPSLRSIRGRSYGFEAETPLQVAVSTRNVKLVKKLLTAGAKVNPPTSDLFSGSALNEAMADQENRKTLVSILLDHGADPNLRIASSTALQTATKLGDMKLMRILLAAGADVNAPAYAMRKRSGKHGRTALQAATEGGNLDLVRLCLDAGASINASPAVERGVTALQAAAIKGHLRIALLLLEKGADVNAPAAIVEGRTAIQGAAEHGRLDMVQLLINAGAEREQFSEAVTLATREGHLVIANLLRSYLD
ncbi:MAG: hypothetical protein M1833_001614 [Piccolia ochrophora]|nr:MAG: hypothetical protein M1833_001614 [Piccolia ochrophora]